MNFQDLFARYREMGAMAPQQSLDEQLFMRNQNVPSNSWTLSGGPLNMDLPAPPDNDNEGVKKERLFKLPSPNTFRPFLVSMDEEQRQGLSGDEEVEDLLQPPLPHLQQGWTLGILKSNSLCKDYYKLTSNMLHTLVMGIREFTDGEFSPAWQIAQDRGHQKHSSFSNMFLQDVAKKPTATSESTPVSSVHDNSVAQKGNLEQSIDSENKCGCLLKSASYDSEGQALAPVENTQDIDGILELRKLLWRQIVPYSCLGTALDPKHDGEKEMKLMQESRMKVVNAIGFGVSSDNYNCTPESCQVSDKAMPQEVAARDSEVEIQLSPGTPSMKDEQRASTPGKTSREVEGMESKFSKADETDEEVRGTSRSQKEGWDHEASKTEYSVSFPEEDDMQLDQEHAHSREVKDTRQIKKSKLSVNSGTKFEQPKSSRNNFHGKETRFSVDGQVLPIFDEEFEIIREEKESPSRYPNKDFECCRQGGDGSTQSDRPPILPKCTTRSWCIVGGFSSKSQTTFRNKHSQRSQKPTARIHV